MAPLSPSQLKDKSGDRRLPTRGRPSFAKSMTPHAMSAVEDGQYQRALPCRIR